MKSNDIDQLLNGLLETPGFRTRKAAPAPQPPEEPKKPVASEASRRRVDEILRSVELETIQKQAEEPPQRPAPPPPPPRREPIPPPEPVSHFSEEPSLSPAVRMHERLDEESLPMLDAERKPNQIIEPKPRPISDRPRKKRKKRPVDPERTKTFHVGEKEAPVQPERPKRKIMHIEVPDELPPDPDLMDAEPAPAPRPKRKRKRRPKPAPVVQEPQEIELPPEDDIPAPPEMEEPELPVPDESLLPEDLQDIDLTPPVPFEELIGLEPEPPVMEEPAPPEEPAPLAPEPAPAPKKRKIMHINVPDELPPDIPRDTSIADAIRKKREAAAAKEAEPVYEAPETYEEAPAEPEEEAYEEAYAEPYDESADASYEEAYDESYDDAEEAEEYAEEEAPKPRKARLRHLSVPAEEPKKEKGSLRGLFSRKKKD